MSFNRETVNVGHILCGNGCRTLSLTDAVVLTVTSVFIGAASPLAFK